MGILLVVAAFAAAHGPMILHNLPKRHWEDGRYFHHNREEIHALADCFTRPSAWRGGAEATYRPLSASLYYLAGRTLFSNRLEVYHAIDGFAHILNAVLLVLLCRELLPSPVSLLPPVLFASRLASRQDIAYTSNFDTLSCAAFGLAGFLLFVLGRRREGRGLQALAVVAIGLSLLCHEAGVAWPAVLTAYGCLFDRRDAWPRYVALWVPAGAWAIAYPRIVRALYPAAVPRFALDLHPYRVLAHYAAYALSFANVLVPNVDPEQAGWAIPPRVALLAQTVPALLLTGALVVVTGAVTAWACFHPAAVATPARVAAFGFAWFLCATAPFVALADRLFMRYSYAGHAGLAVAVGGVAAGVVSRVGAFARRRWR